MIIKKVVKSQTEPPTSCIWVKGNSLYQHINGKWTKFGQAQEDQLNDLQIDNNLHNEFFWAYYKAHPEEIINLPKDLIMKYFPDVLMIIEPLNGSIILPKSTSIKTTINTTTGVITKQMVEEAAKEIELEINFDNPCAISTYNCQAIKYCNLQHVDLIPSCTVWTSYTKPENQLKLIEGLVGWKNLNRAQFDWWSEPEYSTSKRQLWWDEEKITINGDWFLFDENIQLDKYGLKMTNFVRLEGLEATIDREIEFNGTMYFPEHIDYTGLDWFLINLRCYQYPTLDFTRYKKTGLSGTGQYLQHFIRNRGSSFSWTPERPQKCLIKGVGYGMPGADMLDIQGLLDWDYDDMIASLITYAHNNVEDPGPSKKFRFYISQASFDKLTEDDLASIVAMGNSIGVKDNNVS